MRAIFITFLLCLTVCTLSVGRPVEELGPKPGEIWRAIVFAPQGNQESPNNFLPDFKRLVEEAFAPMGINIVIFDMHWNNFRFTCRPELKKLELPEGRRFTAKDARQMSKICKSNGIRVIVGLNFLSHQDHGQLLKAFPEYNWPGTKQLWDPFNPEVNKVAFAMADELIDAFQADGFHAGMDEARDFNLKTHPKAKGWTPSKLFAKCVTEYHEHLVKKRGVEMLIWADMLEDRHHTDTAKALNLIPKDVILCHWKYYKPQKNYPLLKKFVNNNFRVLLCPWKNVKATRSVAKAVVGLDDPKMLGVLYTTWCGKIGSDLRPALLQKGDQSKLDETARGIAASMRATLPMLRATTRKVEGK